MRALANRLYGLRKYLKTLRQEKWIQRVFLASYALLFGFIFFGIWKYRQQIIPYLDHANYFSLVITATFYTIAIACACAGWITVARLFAPDVNSWKHIYIYNTTLASRRLPGTIWYIGGRIAFYDRLGISKVGITIASTIEIIVSIVSGCIVSLILLSFRLKLQGPTVILMIIGALAGLVLLHPAILSLLLTRLGHPLSQKIRFRDTLTWMVAYSSSWLTGGLMFFFLVNTFKPLGLENILYILGSWSISGVGGLLTIFLPSSFGVTDISLTAFASALVPLPMAIVIALINRFFNSIIEVIISVFFYYVLKLE